jgi:two-component system sensor histidine kinase KdpD
MSAAAFTRADAIRLSVAVAGLAVVTLTLGPWLRVSNAAIVSTTYLTVILFVAATSRLAVAVLASVTAMLCLNFFFLPPVGAFTIADPQNWVALVAFLAVSLVASNLSAVARARTVEAMGRRDELARLFDLSRDVLMMSESRDALSVLARAVARRFDLSFAAVAMPRGSEWDIYDAGTQRIDIDPRELTSAFAAAQASLEFDAHARTYAGHRTVSAGGDPIRLVPLRVGTRPIGILAASGRPVEPGTLDTLAGVVAIAIERAHLLEARKAGELAKQGEQLKTALLASIGHDLRTPLTAIRVAASNLMAGTLAAGERLEQSQLILTEAERLTRLFENILEMARIDAGAVTTEARWTHPSEIVMVAREQVEHTVQGHEIRVDIEADVPMRVDPRLTASALAHLLENAGQYTPAGSPIDVTTRRSDGELVIAVRDHGHGIAPADLPHLFDRFYRGESSKPRVSGTGMGLWIVRGLLAVEGGRVWAENCAGGGAQFTIAVPAGVKEHDAAALSS